MIICFTGSGNSLQVARKLSENLNDNRLVILSGDLLINPESHLLIVPQGCENIIWVFPIYSWGVPPAMARFMRKCKIKGAEACRHYMVATCGDDAGYADSQWANILGKRGFTPRAAFTVIMPNVYTLMKGFDTDSDEVAAAKLAAMPARVATIATLIDKGSAQSDVKRGKMPWLKSHVIYPLFTRFAMSTKPFHTTAACTGCATCARTCPMLNITMVDVSGNDNTSEEKHSASNDEKTSSSKKVKPQWGNACTQCLRCLHICPVHAIEYGEETRGKGHFLNPDFHPGFNIADTQA